MPAGSALPVAVRLLHQHVGGGDHLPGQRRQPVGRHRLQRRIVEAFWLWATLDDEHQAQEFGVPLALDAERTHVGAVVVGGIGSRRNAVTHRQLLHPAPDLGALLALREQGEIA